MGTCQSAAVMGGSASQLDVSITFEFRDEPCTQEEHGRQQHRAKRRKRRPIHNRNDWFDDEDQFMPNNSKQERIRLLLLSPDGQAQAQLLQALQLQHDLEKAQLQRQKEEEMRRKLSKARRSHWRLRSRQQQPQEQENVENGKSFKDSVRQQQKLSETDDDDDWPDSELQNKKDTDNSASEEPGTATQSTLSLSLSGNQSSRREEHSANGGVVIVNGEANLLQDADNKTTHLEEEEEAKQNRDDNNRTPGGAHQLRLQSVHFDLYTNENGKAEEAIQADRLDTHRRGESFSASSGFQVANSSVDGIIVLVNAAASKFHDEEQLKEWWQKSCHHCFLTEKTSFLLMVVVPQLKAQQTEGHHQLSRVLEAERIRALVHQYQLLFQGIRHDKREARRLLAERNGGGKTPPGSSEFGGEHWAKIFHDDDMMHIVENDSHTEATMLNFLCHALKAINLTKNLNRSNFLSLDGLDF